MSRVGKAPVSIPNGVQVALNGRVVTAKGSKGELSYTVPQEIDVKQDGETLVFEPNTNAGIARALWGTARALTASIIQGVSEGFERRLSLKGVGYRASVQGTTLNLSLGLSHPVNMPIPQGLQVQVQENEIIVAGADKQKVGQFAAEIRAKRPVEPYKGKGIRYVGEHVVMKEGKKK